MADAVLGYILFCAMGRLIIYLVQKAYPTYKFLYHWFISDLVSCDLCFGVWVFTILAFIMKINLFIVPIAGEILTGMLTSFIVHVWYHGWKSQYQIVSIE